MMRVNRAERRDSRSNLATLCIGIIAALSVASLMACGDVRAQSNGLVLTAFQIEPAAPVTMDTVVVSYTLKNNSAQPILIGKKDGLFVAARYLESPTRRSNRDFGYLELGTTLAPGASISFKDGTVVDSAGTWTFWPGVEIAGQLTVFEADTKSLTVKPRAPVAAPASLGPGRSVVPYQGKSVPVQMFPPDNPWNQDVSGLPVHPMSDQWTSNIGKGTSLHPDFGGHIYNGAPQGIPYVVVGKGQPMVDVSFESTKESDKGPYPIPPDAPIEGGPKSDADRHVLVLDVENQKLYELFRAFPRGRSWNAGSGAIFDLTSNRLRPEGWTSADAAGLPILPGLVRYEEVYELGQINHALRFTAEKSQPGFIKPATHFAADISGNLRPPMGMRVRMKASFDISPFPERTQVILRALKKYGMFLADNGGDWYITGAPHPGWRDSDIDPLRRIKGSQFEVVDTGPVLHTEP
jgi:hypothetical protein